jgi:hypothetical protein
MQEVRLYKQKMKCKIENCDVELRADNQLGLCQKHVIRQNAHAYYTALRANHQCLRCKAVIEPIIKADKPIYRQLCEACSQKEALRRKERKPEDFEKSREYRRKYQQSEKYKAWLQRPEIIERRKAYMLKHRQKKA